VPTCAYVPYVPHVPSAVPVELRVADARRSCAPVAARPDPPSVPLLKETLTVVEVEYRLPVPTRPVASTDPPDGPVASLITENVLAFVAVEDALFVAVTDSAPGDALAPFADQLYDVRNVVPEFGVVTFPPPLNPPSAGNATCATPDRASLADESTVKLPDDAGL
jgi:hypothetical protein